MTRSLVGPTVERAAATGPTLEEIRQWPSAVDIDQGAAAFGVSRSHAYALARRGEFPARVIKIGGRYKIITASIIAALEQA